MHDISTGYQALTVCDVPIDAPVIFITRDHVAGTTLPVVDVWFNKPSRKVDTVHGDIVWRGEDGADAGCIGTFTEQAVRDRFGFVAGFDECVVLDNPKVN